MDLIKEIHLFLKQEIEEINKLIAGSLTVEEELVRIVGDHIARSGGKRIRPVLTLLTAKMFGYSGEDRIKLAAAVEFIHMATLLHDDVVDGSRMRRFLPAANVVWGSKASILVGDFLFSQAFKLIVATSSMPSLVALSDASAIIAEGEVSQLARLQEQRLIREEEYLKIINAKTATLFGAACEVGAITAGKTSAYSNAARDFGAKLGNIFQITDDLLDYFSEPNASGKNIGDDFAEGKVTLPIIFLARKMSSADHNRLLELVAAAGRTAEDFNWVSRRLAKFSIKEEVLAYLTDLKHSACQALATIDIKNQSKKYLELLVDFAINRTY